MQPASRMSITVVAAFFFGACSNSGDWSDQERNLSQHFHDSLAASQAATELINCEPPVGQTFMIGAEEILAFQKAALREAKQVPDTVLDKAHPQLRQHFREEYERYLEAHIRSIERGMAGAPIEEQMALQVEGGDLHDRWVDWLNSNRRDIQMPKLN